MYKILAFLFLVASLQAGGLQGTVADAATSNPIPGTTVALIKGGTYILATTTTAQDGSFSFSNIAADTYTVRATASGYQTVSIGAQIANNQTTIVNFQLEHNPGAIVGKVYDALTIDAISNATVQVIKNEVVVASTTTDGSGSFTIGNLATGNYIVRATTKDYQSYSVGRSVRANQSVTVNFFLHSHPGSLSGNVASALTSLPLGGAIVDVLQDMMVIASATTDALGNYSIPSLSTGNYIVRVSTSNYQINSVGASVYSNSEAALDFSLQPNPGSISGKVIDFATQYPVVGATITVFHDTVNLATALSDPQGNYTIHDLAPGNYTVRIQKEMYQTNDVGACVTSDGIASAPLALRAQPGVFTGRVIDTGTGKPLAGALISAFKENELNGSAYTDEEGLYAICDLAPDTYTIIAQLADYQLFALGGAVAANTTSTVDFHLTPKPREITGRVTVQNQPDRPVPEAIVTIYSGTIFYAIRITDALGYYTIDSLPPNLYSVRVSAPNYQTETATCDLFSNLTQTVAFDLTPNPGSIRGRITQKANPDSAISGAIVTVLKGLEIQATAVSDTNGYYTLVGLAPGTYTQRVSAKDYETTATKITLQSNYTLTQDFALYDKSTLLEGTITNTKTGDPISGALIYVFQEDNLIVSELTDPNGHYAMDELAPSSYTIEVSAKNFSTARTDFTIFAHTTLNFSLQDVPPPPDYISGNTVVNRFLTQSDRIHTISWQRSLEGGVVRYNIYRDGTRISTIASSHPHIYQDHRRIKTALHKYEVRAVDTQERESIPVTITLN